MTGPEAVAWCGVGLSSRSRCRHSDHTICVLIILQCMIYIVQCTMYNVQCTMYNSLCQKKKIWISDTGFGGIFYLGNIRHYAKFQIYRPINDTVHPT